MTELVKGVHKALVLRLLGRYISRALLVLDYRGVTQFLTLIPKRPHTGLHN
jgi:hypothetical protein